jgi:hypothetical protein
MNTTLSPVTVQRFSALQGDLVTLVEQDCAASTLITTDPPVLTKN